MLGQLQFILTIKSHLLGCASVQASISFLEMILDILPVRGLMGGKMGGLCRGKWTDFCEDYLIIPNMIRIARTKYIFMMIDFLMFESEIYLYLVFHFLDS